MDLRNLRHPLTGTPLAPIGHRRNGTPIWPILGGSTAVAEGATGTTATGEAAGATAGATQATVAPGLGQAQQTASTAEATVGDSDTADGLASKYGAAELARLVVRLRGENGRDRIEAKATAATEAAEAAKAETLREVAKALGLVKDDATDGAAAPAAAAIAEELRTATIELEVYRTAEKHGGKAAALTDSRGFLRATAGLNPSDPEFSAKVIAASKEAVQANPLLAATQAVTRTGTAFTGGPGEGRDESHIKPGQSRMAHAYETGAGR